MSTLTAESASASAACTPTTDRPRRRSLFPAAAKGMILATVATVIWSGNFVLADGMAHAIRPVQLAFWRWVIAMLAVAPFAIPHIRRDWPAVRRHLGFLSIVALLGVTLFNTLIYTAGQTSPATNMALEKPGAVGWAGAALSLIGIVVLITKGSMAMLLGLSFSAGDLWMVAAMTTFAGYSLMLRRTPRGISGLSLLLSTFVLGTAFLTPAYAWDVTAHGSFPVHTGTVAALLYVGVLSSAVAYFAWNKAIATVGVARAGIVYYLEPAIVAVLAYFTLGDGLNLAQLISMGLIIIGVALSSRAMQRT